MSRTLEHDWFPAPLPENVEIGERTWLHSSYAFRQCYSRLAQAVRIGNDCGLYKGTYFDLGPIGQVVIGNFCTVVSAIFNTNSRIVVSDYALIAHEVVIAESASAVPYCNRIAKAQTAMPPDAEADTERRNIFIGENAWIGMRAILLGGAKIGEGAIVGAGAVVDFEVPPYTIVAGNPARVVSHIRRST